MKTNKHIEDNLLHYLGLDNPEYAFLISGDWGVGKTFFIDNFINKNSEKQRIVKISLFGLNSSSQINQRIFQELHPILGSKPVRILGNIIKGAISFGFKVDIDSDGTPDANIKTKLDKLDLTEYISNNKEKQKEIVLVFDDLERTDIPLGEALGFINYLVEISSIKTILVANEKILLEESNADLYKKFKEKMIGKTFEVKHDINNFLTKLLKDKGFQDDEIHNIKQVYENSKYKNLRKIKQSLDDFEFAISNIESHFLKNREFKKEFLKIYLALSLEIKGGKLDRESLSKNAPFQSDKESNNYEIHQKYFRNSTSLFHGEIWCEMLFSSDFSKINQEVSKLAYFIEEQNSEKPGWVKLLNLRELEDDEFSDLIYDLENELRTLNENDLRVYLHKISLIIHFSKERLSKISIEEIKECVTKYIEKHKDSDQLKNNLIPIDSIFNGTGYAYLKPDDPNFIDIKKLIIDANKSSYEKNELEKKNNDIKLFITSIKNDDNEYIAEILLEKYQYISFFNEIDPQEFTNSLVEAKNKSTLYLSRILKERYSKNHYINNKNKYSLFTSELKFWEESKKMIDQKVIQLSTTTRIKGINLSSFSNPTINEIITLLSQALQNDGINN